MPELSSEDIKTIKETLRHLVNVVYLVVQLPLAKDNIERGIFKEACDVRINKILDIKES